MLFLSFLYARYRLRANRAEAAKVGPLADTVLMRLAGQKQLSEEFGTAPEEGGDDPWLFLPNLRDDVLRSVHSLSQRERIWQKVRAVVEQNSNVRASQREDSRSGEVGRAWEWIGPLDFAGEGGDLVAAARRRRSGRMSFGGPQAQAQLEGPGSYGEDRTRAANKWEDSRPIY